MKIAITRAGGYDPALGPKHPSNRDPTLEAHVVAVDIDPGSVQSYRWKCSCKRRGAWVQTGDHQSDSRSASNGGARHVAAMERGR